MDFHWFIYGLAIFNYKKYYVEDFLQVWPCICCAFSNLIKFEQMAEMREPDCPSYYFS
jgi:hypothetical protein